MLNNATHYTVIHFLDHTGRQTSMESTHIARTVAILQTLRATGRPFVFQQLLNPRELSQNPKAQEHWLIKYTSWEGVHATEGEPAWTIAELSRS